ncbi:hypothetical protein [Zunongwangia sp. HGR-M22]|uniref:hypothetical protein n=1 Tax=Zunongwangia sp. HGR-M22 TaxID=3015168 RepID=UPI0022DD14FF|nr:hypothetical protein [Zunongwangia sp. HGR-M22]WBL25472.1 hypothetical protein PBT91_16445 [Zunongwangia sp. HGR-M22]
MKPLIFGIILIFLVSCAQNSEKQKPEENIRESAAFTEEFNIPVQNTVLDAKAKEETTKWVAYLAALSEIENLKNTSVNKLIDKSSAIAQLMEELQRTIPSSLESKPVLARLRVLSTKANVLEQKSHLQELNPEEIKEVGIEIPVEFHNLNIQLNELFIENIEDFEAELDRLVEENRKRQAEKRDSLRAIQN